METQKTSVLQEGGHPEIRRTQNEDNHIRKIFNFFSKIKSISCLPHDRIDFVCTNRAFRHSLQTSLGSNSRVISMHLKF